MATQQWNVRVDSTVIDEVNYLSYLMVAGAVQAAIADDPELWRNGGTVLSREEQAAWHALVQELRQRAHPAPGEDTGKASP